MTWAQTNSLGLSTQRLTLLYLVVRVLSEGGEWLAVWWFEHVPDMWPVATWFFLWAVARFVARVCLCSDWFPGHQHLTQIYAHVDARSFVSSLHLNLGGTACCTVMKECLVGTLWLRLPTAHGYSRRICHSDGSEAIWTLILRWGFTYVSGIFPETTLPPFAAGAAAVAAASSIDPFSQSCKGSSPASVCLKVLSAYIRFVYLQHVWSLYFEMCLRVSTEVRLHWIIVIAAGIDRGR